MQRIVVLLLTWGCLLSGLEACKTPDEVVPADDETELAGSHEEPEDYTLDSTGATRITLKGTSIAVSGNGVTVSGSKATITSAGTYILSGTLTNGQVIVNTADAADVKLILHGANISYATSAPLYVQKAAKAIIYLPGNTTNSITDGASYVFSGTDDEPNAALFSKADLTIYGEGSLTVTAKYNDGIASKDGLIIQSGTIAVTAADDGIRGKDYLIVKGGKFSINATGDGFKSDNEDDASEGYITIEDGTVNITSGADAIQAQTQLTITTGTFVLTSGGGSTKTVMGDASAKGLKAGVGVTVNGGTFTINAADDAIHSNKDVVINQGIYTISSGDDGVHADGTLTFNGGNVNITRSYEGIEGSIMNINDGTIQIVASDDGLNVAGGVDSSGTGGPGQGSSFNAGNHFLYVKGGYVYINTTGDGVDVNGSAEMSNGTIIVNGPTANNNGPLDYDGTFKITGGYLLAVGSSGMAQIPGTSSTQNSVLINFTSSQKAGSMVHIQNSEGKDILTFVPVKNYQSVAFSSPALVTGSAYDVYVGGSSTGSVTNGLYQNGTYTAGTKNTPFTISSVTTKVGSGSR